MANKALTTQDFKDRAMAKHGTQYDYSRSVYVNQQTKVEITCSEHGSFHMLPTNHYWMGQGCPTCSRMRGATTRAHTHQTFLSLARAVHGDQYEYLGVYVNQSTKIPIVCKEHGTFLMKPNSHVSNKQGCPRCAGKHKERGDWLKDFTHVHGNRYDYPDVNILNGNTKIDIVCKKHGTFTQTPHMHRSGQGCPSCGYLNHHGRYSDLFFERHPNKKADHATIYVWEVVSATERFIKVGITTTSVIDRIRNNKTKAYTISILFQHDLSLYDAFCLERATLDKYAQYEYTPVLPMQGRTECLHITCAPAVITTLTEKVKT